MLPSLPARTPAGWMELVRAYLMHLLPADLQAEVAVGRDRGRRSQAR